MKLKGCLRTVGFFCVLGLVLCIQGESVLAAQSHVGFFGVEYQGSANCTKFCHTQAANEVMDSVHYQWRSENELVEFPGGGSHGMIDRACGLVGSNALINYYEHCGRCHVGDTLPFPDPNTGEFTAAQKGNLDCLICHAAEGKYDTNNDGVSEAGELADDKPLVFDADKGMSVWHQDRRLEAAESVGGPVSNDACLRCHHHGQADYGYKRGTPFEHDTDVHAAAGMLCTDCHKVDHHKIARGSRVTDMYAWERTDVDVSCDSAACHGTEPHVETPILNTHTAKIGCETCHIPHVAGAQRRVWAPTFGVTEGPESDIPTYDGVADKWLPYTAYDEGLVWPSYRWFAGGSSMLAEPIANPWAFDMQPATADTPGAKILPFRNFVSGQPMDAMGIPGMAGFDPNFTMGAALEAMAPMMKAAGFMRTEGLTTQEAAMMSQFPNMLLFDRADYFANGDVAAAVSIGMAKQGAFMMGMDVSGMSREELIGMGSTMWSGEVAGLDLPDNPYAPGYIDDTDPTTVTGSFITLSHAVKREGALNCLDCHTENGRLDFAELGYSEEREATLEDLPFTDHSLFIGDAYEGPEQCERCHTGQIAKIQAGAHYKFGSDLPDNYLFNEDGTPASHTKSGKLWKLCGFPTTVPQFNWLGVLRDLEETAHVDKPGGCAKCHIGIGAKPYTATGHAEPQASEAENVDCLVCHARDYNRKFYVATAGGEPVLNPLGSPVVMAVPKADGVLDWSVQTEAAKTVGPTSAETCNRCHNAAGGGKFKADEHNYTSFKRGSVFGPGADVHADAGLNCSDCHYAGDHMFKRPVNNDLSAHDVVVGHQMCTDCHGEAPHSNSTYNAHTAKIACVTCHATTAGGVTYKDFSMHVSPDPCDPLGTWGLKLDFADGPAPTAYRWFNGTVHGEIMARGSREDGKIYPYREAGFNQPVDSNGAPVPIKWGIYFKTGNMDLALSKGRELYQNTVHSPQKEATYGIPPVPGEFAGFASHENGGFSVSHGITRTGALTCTSCHSETGVLDFESLGYTAEEEGHLTDLELTDHSLMLGGEYQGPKQCESCHEGAIAHVQAGSHYKFESDLPEGYQYDEDGNEVSITHSGKLWKLCGFPTTVPQFNWLGVLRDLPETAHVDKPGGCAKCHVGVGMKPYTAVGKSEPQASEAENVDCLVCHADNYNRKFYVATAGGEPVLNALGSPVVMTVPKTDGVIDWASQTEAAESVGPTSTKTCNRCHAAAGGGKFKADEHNFTSFKRASVFGPGADVHADAGMHCSDCHYAGDHKFKRPLNNDLSAHDVVVDHQMCTDCHGELPHTNPMYNDHIDRIACTTCHARVTGGVVNKDFSQTVAPDPCDPLGTYGVKLEFAGEESPVDYRWFNGTVHGEIMARGDCEDAKIYPYRSVKFNQPVDANDNPVPVKWGIFFKTGNLELALQKGRALYRDLVYSPDKAAKYGIPEVPGEFDHFATHENGGFSISHGITKTEALTCGNCHSKDGVLPLADLGYAGAIPDFDASSIVDFLDLKKVASFWLKDDADVDMYPADGGDGVVDYKDFAEFSKYWLKNFACGVIPWFE